MAHKHIFTFKRSAISSQATIQSSGNALPNIGRGVSSEFVLSDETPREGNAQGDADFSSIQFEITNKSVQDVYVGGKWYAAGEVVYTMTANVAGDAQTSADLLPYGTYEIREVKTNDAYLLTDGTARNFTIREAGVLVTTSTDGNSLTFTNEVERGGVKVGKIDRE